MVSAGAMLLDRSGRRAVPRRRFRFIDFGGPAFTLSVTLTRARALMARPWSARCYGVARQRDRSRQNSSGARACFLSGISGWFSYPWRVGAEESGAAKFGIRFIGFGRRDAARPAGRAAAAI